MNHAPLLQTLPILLLAALTSCGPGSGGSHELAGEASRALTPPRIIRNPVQGEAERTDVSTGRTFVAGKGGPAAPAQRVIRDKNWGWSTALPVRIGQAAGQAANRGGSRGEASSPLCGSLWAGQDTTSFFKADGSACPSSTQR